MAQKRFLYPPELKDFLFDQRVKKDKSSKEIIEALKKHPKFKKFARRITTNRINSMIHLLKRERGVNGNAKAKAKTATNGNGKRKRKKNGRQFLVTISDGSRVNLAIEMSSSELRPIVRRYF